MSASNDSFRPDARAVMEQLKPITQQLETERLTAIAKHQKAMMIGFAIGGLSWLIALAIMTSGGDETMMGLVAGIAGSIIGGIVFSVMGGGAKKGYRERYKAEVFAKAVKLAVPGMDYFPTSSVPKETFEAGGLFNSRIDRYTGEDCFRGKTEDTELLFSELHVQRRETRTDSKGRTTTHWVTVFKGIYLVADFHKHFTCRVKIVPDVAEATFGWIGRKLQGVTGNLIRLENPDFEKAFKVTATDQQAAMYLMTPDMQERFLTLRNDWSKDIRAVLMDSTLHLAIPQRTDGFEPDMNAAADDAAVLHGFLMRLMVVLRITETLDLNTRIWTKD
ncbi:MAG: DUF3137 domain-containing protein [Luteolibacter sp.]